MAGCGARCRTTSASVRIRPSEQMLVLAVALRLQPARRDEAEGGGVHAVPQPGRRGPVVEDVPEMGVREPRADLGAAREVRLVRPRGDVLRLEWPGEARSEERRVGKGCRSGGW